MPTTPSDDRVLVVGDAGTPGVLLVHPWWGVTDAVRWWSHELAAAGRRVVVPDLYGGTVVTTIAEAEARADAAVADPATGELIGRLADDLAASGQPWAAMGFSLGAFLACPLAARGDAGPDELVLFYGGRPPGGTDVRTRRVDLHVAPEDPFFEPDEVAAVEVGFRDAGADVTVHRYEGAGHWFAEAGSPGHDAPATALARERVVRRLGERR
jgi:carboxymethylenebutenolidase